MADVHPEHPHSHNPAHRPMPARRPGILANFLALAGFFILAIIVIWGLIHLATLSVPFFSNLFSNDNKIVVTAPAKITSGSSLPISWTYTPESDGAYALMYQCEKGLTMLMPRGERVSPIPCGAAYTIGSTTKQTSIIPVYVGTSTIKSAISIHFISKDSAADGPEASGSATVEIAPKADAAPVDTTPTPVKKPTVKTTSSKPASAADLTAHIIAVGVIDPATGSFTQRAPYSPQDIAAVQFYIKNVGGTRSGSYSFQATIPTSQPYTFYSQSQASLAPGAHMINTLQFSPAINGTFTVTVSGDSSTANNSASQWVTGSYNIGNQYQPYQQYQYNPTPYPYIY